jgi:hypothetical protein
MTAVVSFDFDVPSKVHMDLTHMVGRVMLSSASSTTAEVDKWFKVAHSLHDPNGVADNTNDSPERNWGNGSVDEVERLKSNSFSPTTTKSSGRRKRSREEEEEKGANADNDIDLPTRKMKNVNGKAAQPYFHTNTMVNKARLAEKFHQQRVKNNLIAMNNDNTQVLPELKSKVEANAKVQSQAEIAKANASAMQRVVAEKEKKRKEEQAVAALAKINHEKSKKHRVKSHSVMKVRKWEMKTGKQYATLGVAAREQANAEISNM